MQTTEENPPAAAAAVPERMSSFHSYPGSRRWTCMSIRPGSTHFPPASITRPPSMSSIVLSSREKIEERHADGDTGLYLVQYDRLRAVGQFVGQFHSPIDRPRVHDHGILFRQGKNSAVQTVRAGILPNRREIRGFLPLELDPEHHHDIGVPDRLPDVVRHVGPSPRHFPREEGGRAAEPKIRPHPAKGMEVGTDDSAVENIPYY